MAVAGMALARLGQYRLARQALERALNLQPNQFEAAITLAELNLDLGNTQRGAEVLTLAARLRPREFRVWRLLGRTLSDHNDPAGASDAYQKALELKPDDRETMIEMIGLLIRTGQSDLARPWINKAIEKFPDDASLLGLASRGAFDEGRIDDAATLADRALRRDPENPDALLGRARCRAARSRWKEALPDVERAEAASPNDLATLQLLWLVETRMGLTDRAARTLAKRKQVQERARLMDGLTEELKLHPDDPVAVWKMGQVASEAGSAVFARRCFEAALALDPEYRPARESLAALRASHPEVTRDAVRTPPDPGKARLPRAPMAPGP